MTDKTTVEDITYDLAASPNFARDKVCFAARSSGLYRSDDGGHTWHDAYECMELQSPIPTMAVALSPCFASDHSIFAGVPGAILRSFDGGQNWHISRLPLPPPVISTLFTSPDYGKDGTLLAGAVKDGVFWSTDRGRHWEVWNFGLYDPNIHCMAISPSFAEDKTVFVGTETDIFRSINGGRSWQQAGFPTEFAPVLSLALSPGYPGDGLLWAGSATCGLFCSEDRGLSWARAGGDVITEAVNQIILSADYPACPDLLLLLNSRLLVSRDDGKSWSDWKAGLTPTQGMLFAAAPQGIDRGMPLLVGLAEGGVLSI